ncbi:MAG: hypothetical protein AAFY20_09370 [Cyanobacteria bacterium J06639_14]
MSNFATPTKAKEMRDLLEQLLGDRIGRFSDGTKALWVTPPLLDGALSCDGIQVVIGRFGEQRRSTASESTSQSTREFDWKVEITQFDRSATGAALLEEVVHLMRQRFPLRRERSLEEVEGIFPKVSFLVQGIEVINH